jgi:hypothetical protein
LQRCIAIEARIPRKAALWIRSTIAAGLLLLAIGAADWKSTGLLRYLSCLVIALYVSTLKVHLPGLTGTVSFSFTFVLIGVADFSFAETLVLATACGLVQCLWKRHPAALQVWFAAATGAVSAAPAWWVPRLILKLPHIESTVLLLALAAPIYFTINSSLVAAVVALVEEKPLRKLWKQTSVWSYAWFSVQTVIAGIIVAFTRSKGWFVPLCGVILLFVFKVGLKPLSRLVAAQKTFGRKAKRYAGVNSTLEMFWRDSHGNNHSLTAHIVDISEWGARIESAELIRAQSIHVSTQNHGYTGLAAVCYCRFESGKYVIGLEFHRCLTRHELMSFLLTRPATEQEAAIEQN